MIELEVTAMEYGLIVKQGSMTWRAMSVEELFRGHEPRTGARFKITICPLDQGVREVRSVPANGEFRGNRCPRCGGLLFKDQLGEVWCLCG